jgi:hypothetical protein
MPRIPSADGFGEVVPQPVQLDRRQQHPDAYGAGIGRAITGIALDIQQEERATRDAADRASAVRTVHSARDGLSAAHDEIVELVRNGQLPKEQAQQRWQERSKEITDGMAEGVSPRYQENTRLDMESHGATLARGVGKAVLQRDQADVREGLNSALETAGRLFMKDGAAADKMVDDALAQFGPYSGLAPDQLAREKQNWKENSRYTKGYSLVNGARRDNAALDKVAAQLSGPEFEAMDPQRREALFTTLEGYKVTNVQRMEADARRRQAEEERRLRRAEHEANAANSILMTGKMLDAETVQRVSVAVTGTPYEASFRENLQQGPTRAAFGMQPPAVMDRLITEARAQLNVTGTNEHAEKLIKGMEQIRDQAKKDYAEDPLLAAQERGILQAVDPVDTRSVSNLLATLGKRTDQAALVQTQTGAPVSPLLKSEAESVAKTLNVLPLDQRSTAVAQISQALGPAQASALAKQMAPKDKALGIAFGMAGAKTTEGRYTSELVLRGASAIKDRSVKDDNAALTGIRARVAAELGDAYVDQEVRQTMIDAAVFAEYGLQSEGSGDVRRAVNLVTGGITERGGRKVPLPYGMKAPEFEKRLLNLQPADLGNQVVDGKVYVAGTAMDPAEFLKQVPSAALLHAGQGRYAVQTGTGLATNAQGRPLIIQVK